MREIKVKEKIVFEVCYHALTFVELSVMKMHQCKNLRETYTILWVGMVFDASAVKDQNTKHQRNSATQENLSLHSKIRAASRRVKTSESHITRGVVSRNVTLMMFATRITREPLS